MSVQGCAVSRQRAWLTCGSKTYRTPVSVFRTDDDVAVLLPYGNDTDWVKNVQAANGGRVKLSGKIFRVTRPRVVPTADAVETVKPPWGKIMKAPLLLTRAT